MFYNVRMIANMEYNPSMYTIRRVNVNLKPTDSDILEAIFENGQNQFQYVPNCCSVSIGDVVELEDKLFIVCVGGFHQISKEIFENLLSMSQYDVYDFATKIKKGFIK